MVKYKILQWNEGTPPYVTQDDFENELNRYADDGWRIKDIKVVERESIFNTNSIIVVFMEKKEEN